MDPRGSSRFTFWASCTHFLTHGFPWSAAFLRMGAMSRRAAMLRIWTVADRLHSSQGL